ncbi:hypothetical protein [Vibrio owensii]|uniref:hypothetical protein n=1 Tax=Vibrio owensii TaxID=696485 RepID=UPI0014042E3A|nr:hypothetical protein [Vibrio owensii]
MQDKEIKKLIGDLEMMAATAEPGLVMTNEMCVNCCATLLQAANQLKASLKKGICEN